MAKEKAPRYSLREDNGEVAYTNNLGEARSCGCGGVNFTMGPMTLHFNAEEAEALHDLACAGMEIMASGGTLFSQKRGRQGRKVQRTVH